MSVVVGSEHGQQGPTASRPTFLLVQVLRGLAALMVVAHHATILVFERIHLGHNWVNGGSGVDLFFVISGFVMTLSSEPLRQAPHATRTFLARRLERLVPLYWIATLAKVVILLVWPALEPYEIGSWEHVVTSLLFLPGFVHGVLHEPLLVVGWSLNFEMAFYLLFALALFSRRPPLWIVGPTLLLAVGFALAGKFVPIGWLSYYQSSLLLEFVGGMLLAATLQTLRRLPWPAGLLLVVVGLIPLWTLLTGWVFVWRGVLWGIPAMAVVAGVLVMESRWGRRMPRWALQIGDASYSIYLVHTFVLPVIGLALVHLHHSWRYEVTLLVILATVVSTGAGVVCYRWVERPINNWFKGQRQTAVPATA